MKYSVKGFTLIELLLAIGIFAAIALAIVSTFGIGINTWRRSQGILDRHQEVRLVLNRWAREVRNSVKLVAKDITGLEADFVGEKNKLSFLISRRDSIKNVTYLVVEEEDSLLLKRIERDLASPIISEPKKEIILDRLKEVYFSYLVKNPDGEYEFQENWEDKDKFPKQIKLRLILYVPTGRLDEFEEVIFEKHVHLLR